MKKISILLVLVFAWQGCSLLNQPKVETIQIPKTIDKPSALVKQRSNIGVLEANGKFNQLLKANGSPGYATFRSGSNYYFLLETMILGSSLWKLDELKQTLSCMIPRLENTMFMDNFIVTSDQTYMIYSTRKPGSGVFTTDMDYHLISLVEHKPINLPITKDEMVKDFKETKQTGQFLFLQQKAISGDSDTIEVFLWNVANNEKKLVTTFMGEKYTISADGQWLAVLEKDTLVRYSLINGQKEILKNTITDCEFEFVGQRPYLLLRNTTYNTNTTVCTYMKPDKVWENLSFNPYDKIVFFENLDKAGVFFLIENKITNANKISRWDPDLHTIETIFQSKSTQLVFDRKTDTGRFVEYKGNDKSSGKNCFLIYDTKTREKRVFYNKFDFAWPISPDDSIWLFQHEDGEDKSEVTQFMIYNWQEQKEYPLTVNWEGSIFPIDGSNDGQIVNFSCYGMSSKNLSNRNIVMNPKTGREIKFGNYDVIVWLD